MPGSLPLTALVIRGRTRRLLALAKPKETLPVIPELPNIAARFARSKSFRTFCAGPCNAWPAFVSETDRVLRSNSWTPSSLLQLLDLLADGRLRHMKPRGRPAEVKFLRYRKERAQVTDLHYCPH